MDASIVFEIPSLRCVVSASASEFSVVLLLGTRLALLLSMLPPVNLLLDLVKESEEPMELVNLRQKWTNGPAMAGMHAQKMPGAS